MQSLARDRRVSAIVHRHEQLPHRRPSCAHRPSRVRAPPDGRPAAAAAPRAQITLPLDSSSKPAPSGKPDGRFRRPIRRNRRYFTRCTMIIDPSRKYRPFHAGRSPRPAVAVPRDHASRRLVQRRPARRQPGADRADGRRAQAADVPAARRTWATRRSRSGFRRRRRPISTSSRKLIEEDLIPDDVTVQVLTQARER